MRVVTAVVLFFAAQAGFSQEARLQFNQANQLYRDGQYEKAAKAYEEVVSNGYESSVLYYNLGNSYFKLHNIPGSILYYERARRLAPHDDDILYNLRLANLRVVDKIEPVPQLFLIDWWNGFLGLYSSDGWAYAIISCAWFAAAGGIVILVFRSLPVRRVAFGVAVISVMCCILSVTGLVQQSRREGPGRAAIVFSASVPVKSAPDNQSVDLFVLHEGVKVDLMDALGDWKKIRLADGKIGWLTSDNIRTI